MKGKSAALANYVAQKILHRLFLLASSQSGPDCLLEINPGYDRQWSSQFHQLNLETLGSWGSRFNGPDSHYLQCASKLFAMGRLPAIEKYLDFPSSDDSPGLGPEYSGAGHLIRRIPQKPVESPH